MTSLYFQNLGTHLKQKRISAELTQAELADLLKVHVKFVSNWERGLCAPPTHCLQQVLDILKADRKKIVAVMLLDSKRTIEEKIFENKSRKRSA